jgi:hypothetical protein
MKKNVGKSSIITAQVSLFGNSREMPVVVLDNKKITHEGINLHKWRNNDKKWSSGYQVLL